jgi:hypothetical protein
VGQKDIYMNGSFQKLSFIKVTGNLRILHHWQKLFRREITKIFLTTVMDLNLEMQNQQIANLSLEILAYF